MYEHAVQWVAEGHEVTVITCAPNFPEGKVYEGYKNYWHYVELVSGIRVVRVKSYITANKGFWKRSLDHLSFMVSSVIAGMFETKSDIIVGTSPQFFTAVGAWILSAMKRRPFIFEIRDFWPDDLIALGLIRNEFLRFCLKKIEFFLYSQASAIIPVTNAFKRKLIDSGVDASKVFVIPNGVDLSRYYPIPKDMALIDANGLSGKFVVGYIGTHGMAHGLGSVIEAAYLIRERKEIIFLFVGAGSEKEKIQRQVSDYGLHNVKFMPPQSKMYMPKIWSMCDVALVNLRNIHVYQLVLPSKILEAMGMGLPIILSAPEGEATQLIERTGSGVVVSPENHELLSDTVLKLFDNRALVREYACLSRESAFEFNREDLARKMINAFDHAIKGKGR